MSIALLLITHEHIAHNLVSTVHDILDNTVENTASIEVPMDAPIENVKIEADDKLSALETENGILILTDLVGSTPYNVARMIKDEQTKTILITGLNVPMLLKLANYRDLPLDELAEKALLGGQSGIDKHE